MPPHWEVLLDRASQVAAMGCWLGHDLSEHLVASWPVGDLHLEESEDGDSCWHSEKVVMC